METNDYRVEVVKIDSVEKHPNADRLDLVHVRGWQCVTQKDSFKAGELAVYIPIDSVLPNDLEARIFPEGSKIKLTKSRVKTIKLRGAISQGMVLSVFDLSSLDEHSLAGHIVEGQDVTDDLGITHYEPPAPPASMRGDQVSKKKKNPFFPVYSKLSHFKNYPELFEEGEDVVITEKIHGTNFRAGWAPMVVDSVWKKIKKFFGFLPKWEFVVGSHQVQINMAKNWKGFYPTNVYAETVRFYDLEAKIPLGHIVYGEIYGGGIQKGYTYGCPENIQKLAIFDVLVSSGSSADLQGYTSWGAVKALAELINVPTVPVIYEGPYFKASVPKWESGVSLVSEAQKHREGCVVKPQVEQVCWIGRKVLRSINPEYLLVAESDNH
jgi:RNA ligase (TIGR02306 family)